MSNTEQQDHAELTGAIIQHATDTLPLAGGSVSKRHTLNTAGHLTEHGFDAHIKITEMWALSSISDLVEGDADTDGDGRPDYLQSASDFDTRDGGVEASDTIKVGTGCSISSDSRFVDPLLPMLFIIACFMIMKRRLQPQLSGCK